MATLYLFIDACQLHAAIYSQADWGPASVTVMDFDPPAEGLTSGLDAMLSALSVLQAKLERQFNVQENPFSAIDVCVGVSECWLPNETMPWSDQLQSRNPSEVAALHLVQSGFVIEAEDTVRWGDAGWGRPRWTVAYPHALLRALEELARTVNGRLVGVIPAASAVAASCKYSGMKDGVIAYVSGGQLSLLELRDGYEFSTMQRAFDVGEKSFESTTAQEALLKVWQGIQLRAPHLQSFTELNVVADQPVNLMPGVSTLKFLQWPDVSMFRIEPMLRCLHMTNSRLHALNPVKRKSTIDKRSALPLLLSIIAVSAMLWNYMANAEAMRTLEQSSELRSIASTRSDQQQSSPAEKERVAAVNVAIRQLNMPVAELLRALHPPRDIRVALLGVDLSDSGGSVDLPRIKLNAEAPSGEDMTRYLAFLNGRKPFVLAYLVRHEVVQNSSGNPWRFTMELTWRP